MAPASLLYFGVFLGRLMNKTLVVGCVAIGLLASIPAIAAENPLTLQISIPLPGVQGAFDHFDCGPRRESTLPLQKSIFVPELKRLLGRQFGKRYRTCETFDRQRQVGAFRTGVTDLSIIGFAYLFASQSAAHDESPREFVAIGVRPIRKMVRSSRCRRMRSRAPSHSQSSNRITCRT